MSKFLFLGLLLASYINAYSLASDVWEYGFTTSVETVAYAAVSAFVVTAMTLSFFKKVRL